MAIFVVATLLMAGAFYWFLQGLLERQARSFAQSLLTDALAAYQALGPEAFTAEIDERARREPYSRDLYVLFDASGVPLAGASQRLPAEILQPDFLESSAGVRGRIVTDFPNQFRRFDVSEARREGSDDDAVFLVESLPSGETLMVVLLSPQLELSRELLPRALASIGSLMALLGLVGASVLTRVIERRLEALNALSHEIREGDRDRRVPIDGSGDEFDRLAENLNAMLDRIAELLESSRQVTNDIAHDLRTPLTRMRTRLEALRDGAEAEVPHEPQEFRETVDQILADSDALLRLFDGLLRLSGLESGSAERDFERVSLSAIVEDVAELYEPSATEKQLLYTRNVEPGLEVDGDRHLLFQAVANVLENAIKYTPEGGRVHTTLERTKHGFRLVVRDSGPGIPHAEIEKVFDRFYRLESHRSSPGNGLGLSLVRAIVELHRGSIRLRSDEQGLELVVEL